MTRIAVGPLVRATSAANVVIWAEYTEACEVTLRVTPQYVREDDAVSLHITGHTVTVGGRYYIAFQLGGLKPATWYSYRLETQEEDAKLDSQVPEVLCFRTLDIPVQAENASPETQLLRLAYGSCRKSNNSEIDALGAFGDWLLQHIDVREEQWPRVLLLIGDQIYADQPPQEICIANPQLRNGAKTFTEFAQLYTYVWTYDQKVRQALAIVPTYMIFDDHEITNDWNILPTWRAQALRSGLEQVLVDGMVAYWVYQGWGNLYQREPTASPLLQIMAKAAESGQDALEELRSCIRLEVYGKTDLHWQYEIPTEPAIFVANARAGRSSVFSDDEWEIYAPAHIMSIEQMTELRSWIRVHSRGMPILVASVPVLLPPVIGLAEYLMGIRLWQRSVKPLRRLGSQLARIQMFLARKVSFDHWPLFSASWQDLLQILRENNTDLLILSGDVHFSYAAEAKGHFKGHVYQLVSTPLQNALEPNNERLIVWQARIKAGWFGGLRTRLLPLYTGNGKDRLPLDLARHNTLAIVTMHVNAAGKYTFQQEYLGIVDGKVGIVGRTLPQHRNE